MLDWELIPIKMGSCRIPTKQTPKWVSVSFSSLSPCLLDILVGSGVQAMLDCCQWQGERGTAKLFAMIASLYQKNQTLISALPEIPLGL